MSIALGMLFVGALCLALGLVLVAVILRGVGTGLSYPSCGNRICRYDLTGSIGCTDRCPECGSRFAEVGITPFGRRRASPLILIALAALVVPMILGLVVSAVLALRAQQQAETARAAAVQALTTVPLRQPINPPVTGSSPNSSALSDPETGEVYLIDPDVESSMDRDLDSDVPRRQEDEQRFPE